MRTTNALAMLLAVGMVLGMGPAAALGAIVVTPDTTTVSRIGFESDVLSTDLANNDQPTFLSATDTVTNGTGGPIAVINDGTSYPNGDSGFRGYQSPNFLRINLDTTLQPQGYDIAGITSFAGHPDWRASQDYDVSLALVGDPNTFLLLTSAAVSSTGGSTKLMITNQGGGVLSNGPLSASGVSSVRFDFKEAGFGVYREFDVIGATGPQLVQPGGAGAIGEQAIADSQQNIAPGGTATQSSDYSASYPASNAVDGNYGNFSHTRANEPEQWWQVDLGDTYELSEISIFNRYANGHRLTNPGGGFRTSILDEFGTELWGVDDNVYTANPEVRDLSGLTAAQKTGRTVRLSKLSPIEGGDNGTINLAEVEVMATIPGDFTMFTGGTLEIELTPLELVTADKLALTGELTIEPDATLEVLLLSGSPAPGQTFDILDFGSAAGTFTTVNLPGGAGQWDTRNLYTTGEITFGATADIPEPITMLALGLSITGLGGYIRRRRRS